MKRLPGLSSAFRPILRACCVAALLASLSSSPSFAAEETPAPAVSTQPPASDSNYLTFEFNGGTLTQLLTQLRQFPDSAPNIIAPQAALGVAVPPFSVRNARGEAFVAALGRILESQQIRIENGSRNQGGSPVFTVRLLSEKNQEPKEFSCYSLAGLDPTPGVDATVEAVRIAWKLDASHRDEDLRIQFHPATKVLLAHGSREALTVVDRVVSTLIAEAGRRRGREAAAVEAPAPATKP